MRPFPFLLAALALAACQPRGPAEAGRPAEAFALPDRFTALGTEPFWSARVAGDRLTYSTPEDIPGRTIPVTRRAGATFVELRGTLGGQSLILVVSEGACSDGMSDTVYPLRVERRLGADVRQGCVRPD